MITPPKLRNDCFSLPPGVDWVPVDKALARLADRISVVVGQETVESGACAGRVLAQNATAGRANPPASNSAVDGYGFAGPVPSGITEFPLVAGRAAAGDPYTDTVLPDHAVRILTGAILPSGVDTVVLQEDTTHENGRIAFRGPLKQGANTRRAGEDVSLDQTVLHAGHKIRPEDIALLSAVGIDTVRVFQRLRVGVLSTGDEVISPATPPARVRPEHIFDANRPMLLSLVQRWGFEAVDLGHVRDDRDALRTRLNDARGRVDAVLTSGGVSAGDEDHVSTLLRTEAKLDTWRIAVKPGRPLALGLWQDIPVFGLPGNPVAAFVCTLVFARPALSAMAGGLWRVPQGYTLVAAFSKTKKPGRREFLRARVAGDGRVEIFASEGSGRISGLSWADGLVELEDGPRDIAPGDPVRYIPFTSFD